MENNIEYNPYDDSEYDDDYYDFEDDY